MPRPFDKYTIRWAATYFFGTEGTLYFRNRKVSLIQSMLQFHCQKMNIAIYFFVILVETDVTRPTTSFLTLKKLTRVG